MRHFVLRWMLAVQTLCGVLAVVPGAAAGSVPDGSRLALVIGNDTYESFPRLPACSASAAVVGAALARAGFDVTTKRDLTNGQMGAAIGDLAGALAQRPGASAVIYACGYEAELDGRVFLLPASARIERATDLLTQGLPATSLTNAIARSGAQGALVLLDLVAGDGGGQGGLESLTSATLPDMVGLLAARMGAAPPQGPTAMAGSVSDAISGVNVEVGPALDHIRGALAGRADTVLVARPPVAASWLKGGPTPATPAPPIASAPNAPREAGVPDESRMTEADRRRIQVAVQRLGYYDGRVDGIFGPDTRAAIRRFQHELAVEMTGRLTPEQAARLLGSD